MQFTEKLKSLNITKAYIKNGRIYVELDGYMLPTKHVIDRSSLKTYFNLFKVLSKRIFA